MKKLASEVVNTVYKVAENTLKDHATYGAAGAGLGALGGALLSGLYGGDILQNSLVGATAGGGIGAGYSVGKDKIDPVISAGLRSGDQNNPLLAALGIGLLGIGGRAAYEGATGYNRSVGNDGVTDELRKGYLGEDYNSEIDRMREKLKSEYSNVDAQKAFDRNRNTLLEAEFNNSALPGTFRDLQIAAVNDPAAKDILDEIIDTVDSTRPKDFRTPTDPRHINILNAPNKNLVDSDIRTILLALENYKSPPASIKSPRSILYKVQEFLGGKDVARANKLERKDIIDGISRLPSNLQGSVDGIVKVLKDRGIERTANKWNRLGRFGLGAGAFGLGAATLENMIRG